MRLYYPGIEASSPEEAAGIARDRPTDEAEQIHDCEGETLSALVDVQGDQDYRHSVNVYFEGEQARKAAPDMLRALQAASAYLGDHWDESDPSQSRLYQTIRAAIDKGKLAQDDPGQGKDWVARSARPSGRTPPTR
jgi:hypothetical protein